MRGTKRVRGNAAFLTLYLICVWMSFLLVKVTDSKKTLLVLFLLSVPACYLLSSFVLGRAERIRIKDPGLQQETGCRRVFLLSALACATVMMIWFTAFFPGGFTEDSFSQYEQALTGRYSDWHPVWHTLLFFTLPLKLTGKVWAIAVFQTVFFSLGTGYVCSVVFRYAGNRGALFAFLCLMLNYYTWEIVLFPWKDVAFAVSGALCLAVAASFPVVREKASMRRIRCAMLGLILANATLFRHNGILFTGVLLLALPLFLNRRQWLAVIGVFAAAVCLIRGPLYSALRVSAPGGRVVETTGLPMTVLGNIAKEAPGVLDEETADFLYGMAEPERWKKQYVTGSFNSIKWKGIDTQAVEDAGWSGVLGMTARNAARAPKAALKALAALTDTVYGLETGIEGDNYPGIVKNDYGMETTGNREIAGVLKSIRNLTRNSVLSRVTTIGFSILLLLTAVLSRAGDRKVFRRLLLLAAPVLTYDFGTMLLLSGQDSRFFFINYLVCPFIVIMAVSEKGNAVLAAGEGFAGFARGGRRSRKGGRE